jgi:hypothetical protein
MTARRGAAERQAGDRAYVILKLAGDRTLDGPVPGVVHPRCHFIRQQPASLHEELERQDTDVIEVLEQLAQAAAGGRRQPRRVPWRKCEAQDAVQMEIAVQRVDADLA